MRSFRTWIITLGILTITTGVASAGPFSFLKSEPARSKETAQRGDRSRMPTKTRNQKIAEEIAAALRAAKINGFNVDIEFKNGTATISGQVENAEQRDRVTKTIMQVSGVRQVHNRLVPMKQSAKSRKKSGRKSRLPFFGSKEKSSVKTAGFESPSSNGHSPGVRQTSQTTAPGPFPNAANSNLTPTAQADNQKAAENVATALSRAGLTGYDIEIRFQNGTVILGGTVATRQQRVLATQVSYTVPGVKAVDNRLGPQRQPPGGRPNYARQAGYHGPYPPQQRNLAMNAAAAPFAMAAAAFHQQNGNQPPVPPGAGPGGPAGAPSPSVPTPPGYGNAGRGMAPNVYNQPNMPEHSWPSYAAYPNYAQVSYPTQYSASAWPYIGPFYPYPQVPLGWRQVQLEWDDGSWNLNFRPRTDKWFWFLNPENW